MGPSLEQLWQQYGTLRVQWRNMTKCSGRSAVPSVEQLWQQYDALNMQWHQMDTRNGATELWQTSTSEYTGHNNPTSFKKYLTCLKKKYGRKKKHYYLENTSK